MTTGVWQVDIVSFSKAIRYAGRVFLVEPSWMSRLLVGDFKQRYASFSFGLKTDIFSQKLQYEIARSSFYLGLSYSLFANKVDFERDITNEIYKQIPDDNKVGRLAALTPILTYDTRDSILHLAAESVQSLLRYISKNFRRRFRF